MAPKASDGAARVLYWFRTDLRLHDSPALVKALSLSPSGFFPVFCWDPGYIYNHRVGVRRFRFLLESLRDLSEEIKKINPNSQLLVVRGAPQTRIKEVCEQWKITHLAFEEDHNEYARKRDAEVRKAFEKSGIEIVSQEGHHLYPIQEVVKKNNGQAPTSMGAYQKGISSLGDVAKPSETPKSLPDPTLPDSTNVDLKKLFSLIDNLKPFAQDPGPPPRDLNSAASGGQRREGKDGQVVCYDTVAAGDKSTIKGEKDPFSVPTLASLGMDEPEDKMAAPIRGGSSVALKKLDDLTKDASYLSTFAKPKTSPSTDPDDPSTTLLSPYIKFGCLGIRHFWHTTKETKKKYKGGSSPEIPEGIEGQLLFRDMYAACELAVGDDYHQLRGSKICRFADWYCPNRYDKDGQLIFPRPKDDDAAEKLLEAWAAGQTGFPWIDALMRQLRATGWIHHLGRHSVAAFLTRGQLWVSWERGEEVFAKWLIDWDPNSNVGNWLWLSASCFFSQFFRVYSPVAFPKKYDPHGTIVRKYCPELAKFPDKFIYEPWNASIADQKSWGCVIGKDYPKPIVDDKAEKQKCLDRMGYAYKQKLMGDSKEVLDGSAEAKYRKGHGIGPPVIIQEGRDDSKIPAWAKAGAETKTVGNVKGGPTDADASGCGGGGGGGGRSGESGATATAEEDDDEKDHIKPEETDHHDHDEEEGGGEEEDKNKDTQKKRKEQPKEEEAEGKGGSQGKANGRKQRKTNK